jgi:hypothetical protein
MIRFFWSLLFVMSMTVPITAATNTRLDLIPYVGGIHYTGTVAKDRSLITGLYGYYGIGMEHTIEADASWTRIDYDSATASRVNQYDTTLVYTNFGILDWKWRVGAHLITSNDNPTEGMVLLGGVHNYEPSRYSRGVDVYISRYADYAPAMDVHQVTGTWGFYLERSPKTYLKAQAHYIHVSDDIGFDRQHYGSGELSLVHPIGKWTVTVFGWAGQQVFGVQKDGFVAYNLPEKHEGGYGGSLGYAVSSTSSAKLDFVQKNFKELASPADAQASQLLLLWQQTF